jgi:chemotaxis protein MotB
MTFEDEAGGAIEAQEENYFISLTDLMTGVVFIFVILLVSYAITFSTAQNQLKKERERADASAAESKKQAEKMKDALDEIDAFARTLERREERRRTILEDVVTRLSKRGVRISLDGQNGIIRLPEELLFDSGQAALRLEGAQALTVLADELNEVLERWCAPNEDFRLEALFIEGHTDANPIRTAKFADNWELSTARAVNISRALTTAKPNLKEFKSPNGVPVLGVSGYGENRPVAPNSSDEGRRKNRRIDLRFLLAYPTDEEVARATKGLGEP